MAYVSLRVRLVRLLLAGFDVQFARLGINKYVITLLKDGQEKFQATDKSPTTTMTTVWKWFRETNKWRDDV